MNKLRLIWDRFEEGFVVFLLTAMTLVTFVYVILNNFYTFFYSLADYFEEGSPGISEFFFVIGDFILDMAQAMTWSNALTKALFAWLLFFGISYGVRVGGHIGIDALVKLASNKTQKYFALVACVISLSYAGLITVASFAWMSALFEVNIGADDLGQFGIKQWHITLIVPLGFTLVFIRYTEILVRVLRNQQIGLGLADEAADAMKLSEQEEQH
ncbi:TRAP transporter small permease [Marinospirillum insulare]|uniref:TRAP transporter small permease protein n=1 Tax=Marinospirillum insulare TaxID=217169 RepID=A0ABQ6A0L3_9GAMM|nr:TRAP transporter small permease [Marinospirillum insulare]GLR63650.1 C4-dicarboxylate TRAP transporter small permease protein DctQ [Marinospirillum insulare]